MRVHRLHAHLHLLAVVLRRQAVPPLRHLAPVPAAIGELACAPPRRERGGASARGAPSLPTTAFSLHHSAPCSHLPMHSGVRGQSPAWGPCLRRPWAGPAAGGAACAASSSRGRGRSGSRPPQVAWRRPPARHSRTAGGSQQAQVVSSGPGGSRGQEGQARHRPGAAPHRVAVGLWHGARPAQLPGQVWICGVSQHGATQDSRQWPRLAWVVG